MDSVGAGTLNYMQSDYAIAQAAAKLGHSSDASTLLLRAQNYSSIFDTQTGFFRSRDMLVDNHPFTEPFDPVAWGGDYTEGGPWQFRFYVPYDAEGLAKLYADSGRDMCQVLAQTTQAGNSLFHLGGYGEEIHEQTEMTDRCYSMGQYAHNNQPAHHLLYMHLYGGYTAACATQGRAKLRQTLVELYTADAGMFPGDEDNGEMGAWFVLTAMGLYNRSPGDKEYLFGLPLFSDVTVDISDDSHLQGPHWPTLVPPTTSRAKSNKQLRIVAHNNRLSHTRIEKIVFNGQAIATTANGIDYALLKEGGLLEFYLAAP